MKMKNLSALLFALVFMFISTVPSYAIEGEVLPDPEQEETAPIQPPEDEPEPEEPPALPDDPVEPDDETPEDPEDPEGLPNGDYAEGPDDEEPSDEDDLDEGSSDEDNPDSIPGEDEESEENEVGEEEEDDLFINVLVPASGQVIVNPYHTIVCTSTGETTDQIVHPCQALINLSDFPVNVNVTVVGTIPTESEAAFVSAPPPPDTPYKDVFLYAEFQKQPDWWEGSYYDLPNQVPVSEWGDARENVLTLDAQGEGYFRLFGEMSETPEEPWSDTDTFGAVLTFTFAPVYTEPEQTEEAGYPEDAGDSAVPPEGLPEDPETPEAPEETPPEDPEDPGAPDMPEDPDPAPSEETEPSDPPVEDPAPVPADPPGQDAPEPSEVPVVQEGENVSTSGDRAFARSFFAGGRLGRRGL